MLSSLSYLFLSLSTTKMPDMLFTCSHTILSTYHFIFLLDCEPLKPQVLSLGPGWSIAGSEGNVPPPKQGTGLLTITTNSGSGITLQFLAAPWDVILLRLGSFHWIIEGDCKLVLGISCIWDFPWEHVHAVGNYKCLACSSLKSIHLARKNGQTRDVLPPFSFFV